jgi:hypothetical protein
MQLPVESLLAYIDPGSGSYLVQVLVAGILGSGYFLKGYLGKFIGIFRKSKVKGGDGPNDHG